MMKEHFEWIWKVTRIARDKVDSKHTSTFVTFQKLKITAWSPLVLTYSLTSSNSSTLSSSNSSTYLSSFAFQTQSHKFNRTGYKHMSRENSLVYFKTELDVRNSPSRISEVSYVTPLLRMRRSRSLYLLISRFHKWVTNHRDHQRFVTKRFSDNRKSQ